MESRLLSVLLSSVCALATILPVQATYAAADEPQEQVIQPELERRVYTESDIDTEDFEVGGFAGVMSVEDFGTNPVYGVRGAYHITEDFFLEAAYGRTDTEKTSFETLSGAAQLLTDEQRKLRYYNLSVGYNLLPGEAFIGRNHAFNTALYLIAGVGSTEFAGDSHFTINFGAGYRFLITDFIALHIDARDHMFDSDLLGENKTTHNLEAHAGATLFF